MTSQSFESEPPTGSIVTAADPAAPTTFIFLADPQQYRDDTDPSPNYRKISCSDLNVALNGLDSSNNPTQFPISCKGKTFGPINAVFFGGGMCQTGGDYSAEDQFINFPTTYLGGSELKKARALYQTGFNTFNPTPFVGWLKKSEWYPFSLLHNYWRYQMWNFISQMHTGYNDSLNRLHSSPVYPIQWQRIDSDPGRGSFEYETYSLNYVVNLGPVDVFQLHRYGGDSDDGRKIGIQWLKYKPEERGQTQPFIIIIVQHYLFSQTVGNGISPSWTSERNALLEILEPYNIIAFCVGHDHGQGPLLNSIPVPWDTAIKYVPLLRPCCAFNQNFALIRVTPSTMDVLYGTAASQKITWTKGKCFPVPFPNEIWEKNSDWNNNYFGTLRSIYVHTRRVCCSPGKFIISIGLRRIVHPDPDNRLTWNPIAAELDGSEQTPIAVSGPADSNNFPFEGGMSRIWCDCAPVVCPAGSVVVGVFFWEKRNRAAPGLVVRGLSTGIEKEITNDYWGDHFPFKI